MEVRPNPEELELLYSQLLEEGASITVATILEAVLIMWAIEAE